MRSTKDRASERERAHGGLSSYATLRRRSPGKVGRERKAPLCDTPLEILRAEGLRGAGERERERERATNERTDASANSAPALSLSFSLSLSLGQRRLSVGVGGRTFNKLARTDGDGEASHARTRHAARMYSIRIPRHGRLTDVCTVGAKSVG